MELRKLQSGLCPKCGNYCDSNVIASPHGPMSIDLVCQKCGQVWSVFPTKVSVVPLENDHSVDWDKVVADLDWSLI